MTPDPQPDADRPRARPTARQGTWAGLRRTWPILLAAAIGGYVWGVVQRAPAPAATPAHPAIGTQAPRHAWFGDEHPSHDARHVADWVLDSGDAGDKAFVIVDKKDARVYVFEPSGWLLASAPALLGAAIGDDPVPGIGEKPLSQVRPEEKTTPAGRFVAEAGVNAGGEDVVWVSYDLAVSMHRVRPTVKSERRLERLASPTPDDNRISFGCINLPPPFYEHVLRPVVEHTGAIVYVLPETRSPQAQFHSYDVDDPAPAAVAHADAGVK